MPQSDEIQIIGLIRFSYPARSGFARAHDDLQEEVARLHAQDRLERRFRLFEALTVPSLLAQGDCAFKLVVLVGEGFPTAARQRLDRLLTPLENAHVEVLPPMYHYPATQRALAPHRNPDARLCVSFRLDDDDALSLDYIGRLRRLASGAHAVSGSGAPLALSFNHGFYVEVSEGENRVFGVYEKLPVSSGTALVTAGDSDENVHARNHRLLPVFYNCYSDVETPTFIRTIHRDNDSTPHMSGREAKLTESEIAGCLERNFAQPLEALRKL